MPTYNRTSRSSISGFNEELEIAEGEINNRLDRTGTTGNQMEVDIDMNSYDLLNVRSISAGSLTIGGIPVTASTTLAETFDRVFPETTVASMKANTDLVVGDLVLTSGYTSASDGGGGLYRIVSSQAVDGYADHMLDNGNVALLQIDKNTTVRQFGAYDGVTSADDVTANIQACNDHPGISEVRLGAIDCYAQGLTISKHIYGEGMSEAILRSIDNTSAVITVPESTRRKNMEGFRIVGTDRSVSGSKGIDFLNNVSRGKLKDIDIRKFESGIHSDPTFTLFLTRFDGVLIDDCEIGFDFDATTQGYTTLVFINCYVSNSTLGFQLNTVFGCSIIDCAVDFGTGRAFRFLNCRNVTVNTIYMEGFELSGTNPDLITIFNCKGFSLDGSFSYNHNVTPAGDHALIQFDKSSPSIDIKIQNTYYENSAGGNELLFRASSNMDSTTNVIFSGNSQTGYVMDGDLKIRNLDYESIPVRDVTDANGKVTVNFSTLGIPDYLSKVVTACPRGSSGVISPHAVRVEQGGSFANVYLCDFSGSNRSTEMSGTHTGSDGASVLTDGSATWVTDEWVGGTIVNSTDGSSGTITANTASTITATLSGGTDNDWDTSDSYIIEMDINILVSSYRN